MSSKRKLSDSMGNLRKAVDNLGLALDVPSEQVLALEGTIQRYEITVELVWKTLKRGLKYEGIHPKTPRETMKMSFSAGWLTNEIVWQDLLDNRNTSSHEYLDEEFIREYYDDIVRFYQPIKALLEFLENRFN